MGFTRTVGEAPRELGAVSCFTVNTEPVMVDRAGDEVIAAFGLRRIGTGLSGAVAAAISGFLE